jgi:hypothetical protein
MRLSCSQEVLGGRCDELAVSDRLMRLQYSLWQARTSLAIRRSLLWIGGSSVVRVEMKMPPRRMPQALHATPQPVPVFLAWWFPHFRHGRSLIGVRDGATLVTSSFTCPNA